MDFDEAMDVIWQALQDVPNYLEAIDAWDAVQRAFREPQEGA